MFLKLKEIISTEGRKLKKCSASAGHFGLLSLGEQLYLPLGQAMSYDWLRQVMSDCVAFGECGQSYYNVPKALITFAAGKIIALNFFVALFTLGEKYGIITWVSPLTDKP